MLPDQPDPAPGKGDSCHSSVRTGYLNWPSMPIGYWFCRRHERRMFSNDPPMRTGQESDETDAGQIRHRQTGVRMDAEVSLTPTRIAAA